MIVPVSSTLRTMPRLPSPPSSRLRLVPHHCPGPLPTICHCHCPQVPFIGMYRKERCGELLATRQEDEPDVTERWVAGCRV